MIVSELIEKLKEMPQDYRVVFESGDGDAYGGAYQACVDNVVVNNKDKQIELV